MKQASLMKMLEQIRTYKNKSAARRALLLINKMNETCNLIQDHSTKFILQKLYECFH